jgi:transcription elongation factor Elf1
MRKKKNIPDVIFKCTVCGHMPEPSKEKSNANWNVYDTTCSKCGGKVDMDIKWPEDAKNG